MSGLQLGDLVLDSSHVLFIRSLQTLVCSRFFEPLDMHDKHEEDEHRFFYENLETLFEKVNEYQAKSIVFLEGKNPDFQTSNFKLALSSLQNQNIHIHIVSKNFYRKKPSFLEFYFGEVHQELVWGNYRFISNWSESLMDQDLNLLFGTIIGSPSLISDEVDQLPLFIKGARRCFWLPSFSPLKQYPVKHFLQSKYFPLFLENACLFGVEDKRKILPLGKFKQLERSNPEIKIKDAFYLQSESFKTHEW